jgi:peroxidase
LGRRDSTTANESLANANLPSPGANLTTLVSTFASQGLSPTDMTALSGAHTVGQARCSTFRDRIYNDSNIDASFAAMRRKTCPQSSGGDSNLAAMDAQTPAAFDNAYYGEPGGAARPVPLRPGALQRRVAGRAGAAVQHKPCALEERLREGDG